MIYTKKGDDGFSTISSPMKISKADERFNALGSIDELGSHLGLCKALFVCEKLNGKIDKIQETLFKLSSFICFPNKADFKITDGDVEFLESEIDKVESTYKREGGFVKAGNNELSARLDVARTVCRRAERDLAVMNRRYPVESGIKRYINRLSDLLYVWARKFDY
ncbi:MAG: cob(I)yrinic acid a,c-diamide adenosyltransferase, partial [Clostridia bacterium]|nr:cob(I)yrinic acid a,c-diamide adenosyltransferase [Clostridia bacterium]